MNSWCESCARKGCCYTMEMRPRCYIATTNTASGTPESYLAKSLRYSRDNHEIVKDEPTISKMEQVEDKPKLTAKCLNCANGGSYKCSKCDGEMYFKDEPQTERSE